jgi:hypothetical protein
MCRTNLRPWHLENAGNWLFRGEEWGARARRGVDERVQPCPPVVREASLAICKIFRVVFAAAHHFAGRCEDDFALAKALVTQRS